MQIERLPDFLSSTKKQSKRSTYSGEERRLKSLSSERRLQLFQNISRELARSNEKLPSFIDIVEMLEKARRDGGKDLTIKQKKLLYAASFCLTTVYFIAAVDAGKIKIGKTVDIKRRLSSLSTASPVEITLICTMDYDDGLEVRIHQHLKEHRSHGEWFYADKPVLDFIRNYKQNGMRWVIAQVGDSEKFWMNNRGMMPRSLREQMMYPSSRTRDVDYAPNTQNKSGIDDYR